MTAETVPPGPPGQSGGEGAGPAPERDISPEILEEIHAAALAGLPTDKPTGVVPFVDVTPRLGKKAERRAEKDRQREIARQTGSFQIVSRTERAIDNPEKTDILIEQPVFLGKNKDGVETWGQLLVLADTSQGPQTQITYDDPERVAWARSLGAGNVQIDNPNSPSVTTRRLRSGNYDEDRAAFTQTIQEWTTLAAEMVPANLKFNLLRNRLRQNDMAHAVVLMVGQEVYVAQCGTTMVQVVDRAGVTRNISFDTPDVPIHLAPTDTLVVASDGFVSRASVDVVSPEAPPTPPKLKLKQKVGKFKQGVVKGVTRGVDKIIDGFGQDFRETGQFAGEIAAYAKTGNIEHTGLSLSEESPEAENFRMTLWPNHLSPLTSSIRKYEPDYALSEVFDHTRSVEQAIVRAEKKGQNVLIADSDALLPFARKGDQTLVLIRLKGEVPVKRKKEKKTPPQTGHISFIYEASPAPKNTNSAKYACERMSFSIEGKRYHMAIVAADYHNPNVTTQLIKLINTHISRHLQHPRLRPELKQDLAGISQIIEDAIESVHQQYMEDGRELPKDKQLRPGLAMVLTDGEGRFYILGDQNFSVYRINSGTQTYDETFFVRSVGILSGDGFRFRFAQLPDILPGEHILFTSAGFLQLAGYSFDKIDTINKEIPPNPLYDEVCVLLSPSQTTSANLSQKVNTTQLIKLLVGLARDSQQAIMKPLVRRHLAKRPINVNSSLTYQELIERDLCILAVSRQ